MQPLRLRYAILAVTLGACTTGGSAGARVIGDPRFDQAMKRLKGDISEGYAGQEVLAGYPSDAVVPVIVDLLRVDPGFTVSPARDNAYRVLLRHRAQYTAEGFAQLIAGLNEPKYRAMCATGLWDVPTEYQEEAISALGRTLENANGQIEEPAAGAVIRALARHGKAASRFLARIEEVFNDRTLSPSVRGAAAYALPRLGTPERALEHYFKDPDVELHAWPLGALPSETNEAYTIGPETRKVIRDFVRKIMRSERKEVRAQGFEALGLAYGDEFLIADPVRGFRVNPEFEEAIVYMAEKEPDERLRQRAIGVRDTLDERVAKAIHKRERRSKSGDADPVSTSTTADAPK